MANRVDYIISLKKSMDNAVLRHRVKKSKILLFEYEILWCDYCRYIVM